MKKRSGRPASLNTQKTYTFCVYKDGKWVEATGETQAELDVFESLKDSNIVGEYLANTLLPKNLPANIQWEKSALKILGCLKKEVEYDFFMNSKHHVPEFQVSWDQIYKYPDANKEPTNMSMIKQKLENNEYFCLQDWCDDMSRVFNNVLLYNQDKEVLVNAANFLRKKFNSYYNSYQLDFYLL